MWWVMAAQAAIGAINSWSDRQLAKINTRLSEVQAETSNRIRTAGNEATASKNNLARFMQSLANKKRMEAGGEALEANTVNTLRERDAMLGAGFTQQIRFAEQAGRARVMQALSGADGSVADSVNAATALRQSMVEQRFEQAGQRLGFDSAKKAEGILRSTIDGLDSSIIFDNLDFRQDYSQKFIGPKWQHAAAMAVIGGNPNAQGKLASDIGDKVSSAYDRWFNRDDKVELRREQQRMDQRAADFKAADYTSGISLDSDASINTLGGESGSSFSSAY